MCGRFSVEASLNQRVSEALTLKFFAEENKDLKPTQQVSIIASYDGQLKQLDTTWGIKPSWAKNY